MPDVRPRSSPAPAPFAAPTLRARARACFALLTSLLVLPVPATQDLPSEARVKAAFFLQFLKFVTWPDTALPSTASTLAVAVIGDDAFARELEAAAAGRQIQGRDLAVRRRDSLAHLDSPCHAAYLGSDLPPPAPAQLRSLRSSPLLLVGHQPECLDRGTAIAFSRDGNKIRFEINLDATEAAGLRLSSQLLRLAQRVRRNGKD